jgi:putative DNA primase/helicase
VPFEVTVSEDKIDRELPAALEAEAPGILNWAIAGYRLWQRVGLLPPKAVTAATAAYRAESDPLGEFFEDCVIAGANREVLSGTLFGEYQRWADGNGIRRQLTQPMLGKALKDRGFTLHRGTGGRRWWRGLDIRPA